MSWLNQHKNQVRSFIIGAIVIGLTLLAATGVYLYRERKATELMIEMRRQESEAAAAESSVSEPDGEITVDLSADTITWQGKTYKKNTYIKAILCMGVDRSDAMTETMEQGKAGQADGIFLIAQDTAILDGLGVTEEEKQNYFCNNLMRFLG